MKELIKHELQMVLRITRGEGGLSLEEIAKTIKEILSEDEVKAIIKELNK